MKNALLAFAVAAILPFATSEAAAQAVCDRTDLQGAVKAYLAAQASGDAGKIPLADFTQYTEQAEMGSMSTGILSKPLKIDFTRSLLDVQTCTTFTELIVTDPAHPYVIGTRLQYAGRFNPIAAERINDIEAVVTDRGDWLFNADKTLLYAKAENWSEIPAAERDGRATILAAANAYLDSFSDKAVTVPWGSPCARLEGGLYTAKGAPGTASADDRCDVGIPSGVKLTERHYVVDETIGAVAVLLLFGTKQSPDVHLFRIEKGKIRYVHTMTACKTDNCGIAVSDDIKRRLQD